MARLLSALAVLCLVPVRVAIAGPELPEGYVSVATQKYVWLCAKGKNGLTLTQKADILDGLKLITERYEKQFGLDREVMRIGADGGLFKDLKRDPAALLVFPNMKEFQDWVGNEAVGGITYHVGRHENVVGVPLEDGKLSPLTWHVLWHEFSHVFFHHHLALGRPMWLNEGLAEYFGFQNPHSKEMPSDLLPKMLDGLKKRRDDGTATKVSDLMERSQDQFGRQQYDESWVLVHMLMTEATSQLNDLMSMLVALESDAWADGDGVEKDLARLARTLLEGVFGGEDGLQRAWEKHLDSLIANPALPPKCGHAPKSIDKDAITPSIDARLVGTAKTVLVGGIEYKARHPKGSVVYRAPWPASVRVTLQIGLSTGKWADEEWILIDSIDMKKGKKVEFKELYVPAYEGGKSARLWVEWKLERGGTYRTVKQWDYK